MTSLRFLIVAAILFGASNGALGADARAKKALLIGIDGCRPDAIDAAVEAYQLKALIKEGVFYRNSDVLGDRPTVADTITGPGWSSVLAGVWADKHGVKDNAFRDHQIKHYPMCFSRLRKSRGTAKTLALVSWRPFVDHMFAPEDDCRLVMDGDKEGYQNADRAVADAAVKALGEANPDAIFVYFGNVDSAGHGYGFHPRSPKYTKELETVDGYIGQIRKALHARKTFDREDWLTLVCTDHGGRGREHGIGKEHREIRTGFIIAHGPSVKAGAAVDQRVFNVDVAATLLAHFGVAIDPVWKFDGAPLKVRDAR